MIVYKHCIRLKDPIFVVCQSMELDLNLLKGISYLKKEWKVKQVCP